MLIAVLAAFAATSTHALAQGAGCKLQKVVEWKVRSIGRHMAVDGAINGNKIGIVLDTGATISMLFRGAAKRLGLNLTERRGMRIYGVGGESSVHTAVIDEFKLGEAAIRDFNVTVSGDGSVPEGFDLLLGEDFLRNFDIEFDLAHDAVRLWQAKDCGTRSLAYWTKEVVGEVEIEAVTDMSRKIAFTVQLNGKPTHAILDSGASTTVVSAHDADRLGVKTTPLSASSSGVGAKSIEMSVGKFATFAIGNEEIPDVEIVVANIYKNATYEGTGSRIAKNVFETQPMLIGADFLRSHRTLVSHTQRRMYFTYVGGPVFVTGRKSPVESSAGDTQKAN